LLGLVVYVHSGAVCLHVSSDPDHDFSLIQSKPTATAEECWQAP